MTSELIQHNCLNNIHRKTLALESFLTKGAGLNACNFIKKKLRHRRYPVTFSKFLRTPPVAASSRLLGPPEMRKQKVQCRGGSRTAATSKMERFVILVNDWKPLTIITKLS